MKGRGGFTLIEVMIVAILGTILLGATYQILVTNQQTYRAQNAQIQNQQSVRAGWDILFAELREISPQGGDLLAMGSDSLSVRLMRTAAVICEVELGGSPRLRAVKLGRWFTDRDSVFIFAEHSPATREDDSWIKAKSTARDTTKVCANTPERVQELQFVGGGVFVTDTPSVGGLIRAFENYTYTLAERNGSWYLARRRHGETDVVPLVGPLRPPRGSDPGGISFTFLDEDGHATTDRTAVRQIGVTLRTLSQARDARGEPIEDSLTTRIYTRN